MSTIVWSSACPSTQHSILQAPRARTHDKKEPPKEREPCRDQRATPHLRAVICCAGLTASHRFEVFLVSERENARRPSDRSGLDSVAHYC